MPQTIINETIKFSEGPACVKQSVYVKLVCVNGDTHYGSNEMKETSITTCPRVELNYPTGEGYHHCKDTCKQEFHAERQAIQRAREAGSDTTGASIYLVGHYYCCDDCTVAMKIAGIKNVFFVEDNYRELVL